MPLNGALKKWLIIENKQFVTNKNVYLDLVDLTEMCEIWCDYDKAKYTHIAIFCCIFT